jgi:hypothetical protein
MQRPYLKEAMTDPERKKSYLSMFEKVSKNRSEAHGKNGHAYPGLSDGHAEREEETPVEEESYVLTDEMDHQILMHRDAHFGGDFKVMLNYYANDDRVGVQPDFDIERITYLANVEKEMGQDLAPLLLAGVEAEAVGKARQAYAKLKEIYALDEEKNTIPRLIADLILSEEEEPLEEIEKVVSQGTRIIPDLLHLLNAEDFYSPLYPGYGYAPYLAIVCLGKIGDARALIPIFETLSRPIVFDEMVIVEALAALGEPAKQFLLKILTSRPLTHDNIHAAFALVGFSDDPEVAIACFEQLLDSAVQEKPLLRTYLLSSYAALPKTPYREKFIEMANDPKTPADLRADMQQIVKEWSF